MSPRAMNSCTLSPDAVEARVVERVVAQLVALLVQELHLLVAPLRLLPLDPLVAEERAARPAPPGSMQNTALRGQSGCLLGEVLEDADRARRVDLELAVALDVAELRRRRVVEHEHDRRDPLRQLLDLLVDDVGHVHRAVAALVQLLEVAAGSRCGVRVNSFVSCGTMRWYSSTGMRPSSFGARASLGASRRRGRVLGDGDVARPAAGVAARGGRRVGGAADAVESAAASAGAVGGGVAASAAGGGRRSDGEERRGENGERSDADIGDGEQVGMRSAGRHAATRSLLAQIATRRRVAHRRRDG